MARNVLKTFRDMDDHNKLYRKDKDLYPRKGYTPSAARLLELSDGTNKRGVKFISEVEAGTEQNTDDSNGVKNESLELETVSDAHEQTNDAASMDELDELTIPQLKAYLDKLKAKYTDKIDADYKAKDSKDELIKKLRAAVAEASSIVANE